MLNGVLFIRENIISLDLQHLLAKHYRIVNVFRNIEDNPENCTDTDFIIIDTDFYSEAELRRILNKFKFDRELKIVTLTSQTTDIKSNFFRHKEVQKPFNRQCLLDAIEQV